MVMVMGAGALSGNQEIAQVSRKRRFAVNFAQLTLPQWERLIRVAATKEALPAHRPHRPHRTQKLELFEVLFICLVVLWYLVSMTTLTRAHTGTTHAGVLKVMQSAMILACCRT